MTFWIGVMIGGGIVALIVLVAFIDFARGVRW